MKAIDVLKAKGGVKVFSISPSERAGFSKKGAEAADRLAGKIFSRKDLEDFRSVVKTCK